MLFDRGSWSHSGLRPKKGVVFIPASPAFTVECRAHVSSPFRTLWLWLKNSLGPRTKDELGILWLPTITQKDLKLGLVLFVWESKRLCNAFIKDFLELRLEAHDISGHPMIMLFISNGA